MQRYNKMLFFFRAERQSPPINFFTNFKPFTKESKALETLCGEQKSLTWEDATMSRRNLLNFFIVGLLCCLIITFLVVSFTWKQDQPSDAFETSTMHSTTDAATGPLQNADRHHPPTRHFTQETSPPFITTTRTTPKPSVKAPSFVRLKTKPSLLPVDESSVFFQETDPQHPTRRRQFALESFPLDAIQTRYQKIRCGAVVHGLCWKEGQPRYFTQKNPKDTHSYFTRSGGTTVCNEAVRKTKLNMVLYATNQSRSDVDRTRDLNATQRLVHAIAGGWGLPRLWNVTVFGVSRWWSSQPEAPSSTPADDALSSVCTTTTS